MTEAIPRPWVVEGWSIVRDAKEARLRHLIIDDIRTADVSNEQAAAHAALIVRAVNRDHHFGALVEHLRRMIDDLSSVSYDGYAYNIEPALAALKAAEEATDTTPLCCGCEGHEATS